MPVSFTQIMNIARSGMLTRLTSLDTISDNLSNIQTPGFKRGRTNFQELLNQSQLGGSQISSTQFMMTQGQLKRTENSLDLAIRGKGFFALTLPDGRTAYTRDGQFYLDAQRRIVNADGFPLDWEGEIPEGAEDVHVNPDGAVMVLRAGAWSEAGRIELAHFANPSGLLRYGQNLWLETEISGEAQTGAPGEEERGVILAKAIEQSNVNLAEEMVNLSSLQRSFEMSLRVFQQTDEMLSQAIHLRRG